MVGDWVRNDLGEVQRVVEIREGSVMLFYNDMYNYDDIEPIPLTPEILEKNGWKVGTAYSEIWIDKEQTIKLEFYHHLGSLRKIYIHNGGSEEVVFRCDAINYVHTLQHTLRLCGITKTIEV